jgi:undecaprenyl-diphosphatase
MESAEVGSGEAAALGARAGRLGALVGRVVAWDLALLRYLASRTLPRAASLPLIFLVRIGDGWIWVVVAVSLYWALPLVQVKTVVAHCLVAIAMSLSLYWPVKLLVRRTRPHESGLGITARVPPLDKFSFPSGHTMNNLAVALTLSQYVAHTTALAVGLPLVLGALRILFGVHFLSDITGGAILGAAAFLVADRVFAVF